MRLNHLIFTLLLFIAGGVAYGQNYTFKVLANKGENKVKVDEAWSALKTGASLDNSDELIISDNAYLGLVHASGKTLEVKTAGTYKVSDLAAKINIAGSSVASKYADFVLSKMSAEGKKNRLSATGAVHRGSNEAINIFLPNSAGVYKDKVIVRWDSLAGDNRYEVVLKNMFNDVLLTIETNEPNIELDLTKREIANEKYLLLTVNTTGDDAVESGTYAIKRLPEEDVARVEKTLNDLLVVVDEETALNKYILAGFFEENNLLIDALTSFEEAIHLAPGVASYKDAYIDFLLRNHLSE
ncbi:MAG: hypothetical protein WD555_05755 [Fulvivirga sp.]